MSADLHYFHPIESGDGEVCAKCDAGRHEDARPVLYKLGGWVEVADPETVMTTTHRRQGDPRFHALLDEIGRLHDKKQADYGAEGDPFANVRASQEWGVPAWVGALVRLNDKVHRLKQFAQRGTLANESAEDSMLDIAVYALIALVLYREAAAK